MERDSSRVDSSGEVRVDVSQYSMNLENFSLGGKYLLFQPIARGDNSVVYYGTHKESMQERAFKFYNFKEIEDQSNFTRREIVKRVSKIEWKVMRECQSINVLACEQVYEDRDHRVQVYEYCPTTLEKEITHRGNNSKTISQTRAIFILRQILAGLKSFHRGPKVMHTSLEPKHIFIRNGIYKIAQAGLPSIEEEVSRLVAPQILRRTYFDSKAEVWNIGLLFHQILLGGLPPIYSKDCRTALMQESEVSLFKVEEHLGSSQEVKDFLWKCLIPDVKKRMTWSEMENHPMFSLVGSPSKEELPKQARGKAVGTRRMSVIFPLEGQEEESEAEECFHSVRCNWDQLKNDIRKQLQSEYKKEGRMFEIQQLQKSNLSSLKARINYDEDTFYKEMKKYYLRCLKVEFVYFSILRPLELAEIKPSRSVLELLYLIAGSCFSTISKVKCEYKKYANKSYQALLWACVAKETVQLYEQVRKIWTRLGEELIAVEDSKSHMFFDAFRKLIKKEEMERKDRFLNGIENLDYLSAEKIKYTAWLAASIKSELAELREAYPKLQVQQGLKYLEQYSRIWQISEESNVEENYPCLRDYIDAVLLGKDYSEVLV